MRVLVACEYSGRVTAAFRRRGHFAVSVDLLPTEGNPAWHHTGDVATLLAAPWDMLIAFPPCTDLAVSGSQYWPAKRADGRQDRAAAFFLSFAEATHIPRRCVENPQGDMSNRYRKPDQYVHPYMFGQPLMKRTGLWLYGLPLLQATDPVEPTHYWTSSSNRSGARLSSTGAKRNPRERSRTFQSIADAMATQWG